MPFIWYIAFTESTHIEKLRIMSEYISVIRVIVIDSEVFVTFW